MKTINPKIRNFKETLQNGLTVISIEMPHIHTLEIAMFIRAGLRFENKNNNGISHFLEHMMFRGNNKYPDSVLLNKEFENLGRDLRASTLSEYTYYGFSPHPSNLEPAMVLFASFFKNPTFEGIELERQIILEEYLEDLNAEGANIDINNHACQLLYRNTSLAMPTIGTESSIKKIDRTMLEKYFKDYYIPENMILTVAGQVTHDSFYCLAEHYFSDLINHGTPISKNHFLNTIPENQTQPNYAYQYDLDSQIQLQLCFRAVSYNDSDYYAVYIINRILDDGISSRLQRALREKLGLAYSIECRATSLSDVGTFDFDVTVSKEKVYQVVEVILQEIQSFLQTGPKPEELEHVKKRYIYDLDFELDDPYKQILRFGFVELFSEEVTLEEEKEIIERITCEQLHRIVQRIFIRENLNLILVGPFTDDLKSDLESLVNRF